MACNSYVCGLVPRVYTPGGRAPSQNFSTRIYSPVHTHTSCLLPGQMLGTVGHMHTGDSGTTHICTLGTVGQLTHARWGQWDNSHMHAGDSGTTHICTLGIVGQLTYARWG